MFTDTHTHLYSEAFDLDRDIVMQQAKHCGVSRFFIPAIDSSYAKAMYDLEASYPDCVHLMMGLHPTSVKENYKEELCVDCQKRLENNALRVLDCKVDNKKEFFKKAPILFDSLGKESKEYFNKVIKTLEEGK